jgi:hypothetical protein
MSQQSVIFEGVEFYKINKFDCVVIDLQTPRGGRYATVLPVSSRSRVSVLDTPLNTSFTIADDWGKEWYIVIPAFMKCEIEAAKAGATKVNSQYNCITMSDPKPVTALEAIRQDKKTLENSIETLCREFETKYPGFEVEGVDINHMLGVRGPATGKFHCELKIKIPWL